MVRTQIYLTSEEQDKLKDISAETGKPQSQLIREAIDLYVVKHIPQARKSILKKTRGIWKNRSDLKDLDKIRKEFDRC